MSTRKRVDKFLSRIYSKRVRKISKRIGLHSLATAIYTNVVDLATTIDFFLSAPILTIDFDDISVDVCTNTRHEFARVKIDFPNEISALRKFISHLDTDDVVWDVGANIGVHTCLFASRAEDGIVVAFEPLENNSKRIRVNVSHNELHNVSVEQMALSDVSGRSKLFTDSTESGVGNASLKYSSSSGEEAICVVTKRGDELISEGYVPPTALKIDVEGAEIAVLEGLDQTLAENSLQTVLCEVHTMHSENTVFKVKTRLENHGFATELISNEGTYPFVFAQR